MSGETNIEKTNTEVNEGNAQALYPETQEATPATPAAPAAPAVETPAVEPIKAEVVGEPEVKAETPPVEAEKKEEEKKDTTLTPKVEYADFKLQEGASIDEGILTQFKELAQSLNIPQDKAQALLDLSTKGTEISLQKQQEEFSRTRDGWIEEIKIDKEFGGSKFEETNIRAVRAVKNYGDDKLVELLNSSGLGDHPSMIKVFARLDKALGNDISPDGNSSNTVQKTAGQIIYGNTSNK